MTVSVVKIENRRSLMIRFEMFVRSSQIQLFLDATQHAAAVDRFWRLFLARVANGMFVFIVRDSTE